MLRSDSPALLDVRWELGGPPGRPLFEEGHIPGAAFVDLDTELAGPPGAGGRHPLPAGESFQAAMRGAGVSNAQAVVVYDARNSVAAARGWWLLRYFGHAAVAVLDGGLAAWVAAGLELETGPRRARPRDRGSAESAELAPGNFVARPGSMPALDAAGTAEVGRGGVLLDARAPERFRGESEPIDPVAGHIPGAVNVPGSGNLDDAGRFLPAETLRARFAGAGVRDGVVLGAYCGSGVSAAHEVLALDLAGYQAALYVGSWSEWVKDPARPVATGE